MSANGYLSVKNWRKYQHYRDRKAPWLKLYKELLRDYEFAQLSDASKLLLMLFWLLALEHDNEVPNDLAWIRKELPINGKIDLKPLIDNGYIYASNMLAKVEQDAPRSVSVSLIDNYYKEQGLLDLYREYKKMRVKIKAPLTEQAEKILVTKHKQLTKNGSNPQALIERAIERCWKSFFPSGEDSEIKPAGGKSNWTPPADLLADLYTQYGEKRVREVMGERGFKDRATLARFIETQLGGQA